MKRTTILTRVNLAARYCLTAITRPRGVFRAMSTHSDRLNICLWILVLFAGLYSVTSMLLYLSGRLPLMDPWMPIAKEDYYLYQTFWTIPWGLATAILMAGIAHIMAVLGRENKNYSFEAALSVISISWVVPSFVLMWLPETFVAPLVPGNMPIWSVWIDVVRLSILAPLWQVALTTIGIQVSHQIGFPRALLIGVVTTVVSFLMFLPFMR